MFIGYVFYICRSWRKTSRATCRIGGGDQRGEVDQFFQDFTVH